MTAKSSKPAKKKAAKLTKKKTARKMPVFSKPSARTLESFDQAIAGRSDIERRTMFGYPSAFVRGNMLACVFQDRIMVRLSETDRKAAMTIDGARPFEPSPGRAMKEYVDFPRTVIDDRSALREWIDRGANYVATLPPKKKKAGRS